MKLELVEFGNSDPHKEYDFLKTLESENGFENNVPSLSYEEYVNIVLPRSRNYSKGIGLDEGHVPQTNYLLKDGDVFVGVFKVRHYCNDVTRTNGAGHIGYGIHKDFRRKGYATAGIKLAIEKLVSFKDYDPKDNVILGFHKYNIGSRKAQENNGAKIIGETEIDYITQIDVTPFLKK